MKGIDFSYWRPPSAQWVRDQGFGFVCRYLSYDAKKGINKAEFDTYRQADLAVVLVWENGAQDMLTPALAARHAQDARAQAQAIGAWPCVIYFAADFVVTPAQQVQVNEYLDFAEHTMGHAIGVYGGYWCVSRAMAGGHCGYGWQTYAWSGGQWYFEAQIRQEPGGNASYDLDESMTADYGQIGGTDMNQQEHDWLASIVTSLGLGTTDATQWPNYKQELADIKAELAAIKTGTAATPLAPGTYQVK